MHLVLKKEKPIHLSHNEAYCMLLARQTTKTPRLCRVSPGFEPARAGGSLPRNAALAQAYRVIPN
jgi:hypothetical protein